jgi:hypothetical protein
MLLLSDYGGEDNAGNFPALAMYSAHGTKMQGSPFLSQLCEALTASDDGCIVPEDF